MTAMNEAEILLVEDNATDAEMTLRALKSRNVANKVLWVKDGVEALDFMFATGPYSGRISGNPKVVLLDLRLPKVDGLEVLKKIRSDERTKMVPVVVLSSSKEDRDIIDSYQLGVNSYVSKPVGIEAFLKPSRNSGFIG